VALKILPTEGAADSDRLARFIREAKAASALNHPNIITIHDIGNAADTHFIAYELVDCIADGVPCGRAWAEC
jgi:serine/threonine protein kinase